MRIAVRIIGGLLCLALGAGTALAQSSVKPGGVVAGGGASTSTSYALKGTVGGWVMGASTSTGYKLTGGLLGAAPFGPIFTVAGPITPPPAGSPVTITATVQSGPGATLQLYYRLGGQSDWPYGPVTMTSSDNVNFSGNIPGTVVGSRGGGWYVLATQNGLTSTMPPTNATTDPYLGQIALTGAGTTLPDAQYRLFSFPFDVDPNTVAAVFQDDLGAPDSTQWRLGKWDQTLNAGAGGYRSYDNVGAIARRQGYWLIARGGKAVRANGVSPLPDYQASPGATRYASITLTPGWNMVGTPFDFSIPWSQRIESVPADIEDTAWNYVGGTTPYSPAANFDPYRAYWVRNTANANRTLWLPFAAAPGGKSAPEPVVALADRWEAKLVLSGGGIEDRAEVLGVRPEARDGYDSLDYSRPPYPPGAYLSVVSVVNDPRGVPQSLAGDFRAPGSTGQRFELLVRGNVDGTARIALAQDSALPAGYTAALVDVPTGLAYTLPEGGSLTLPRRVSAEGARYDLVLGPAAWIRDQAGEPSSMPARVALAQNYPNPFNPQTTIAFDLPAPGSARVQIFNAAGRRVAVLWDKALPAGHHTLKWDGRDSRGRPAASGQYFCRLDAGDVTLTQRMMLVR